MLKGLEVHLVVPDLWQQQAVRALQSGQDVVVQAPTGSGKTYIFELLYPSLKGQAIFTVPTRALANDKLAEWRAKGWDVGIATGDLALNLDARVLVATLETQRARFLRRDGPKLLVVDEYQMIGDPVRGVHYELALALAPPQTQLLLLSGSVGNPQDIVAWFQRIGRDAILISHKERPVPLEEVDLRSLSDSQFVQAKGFWPRMIGRALRADLAPVLMFAPRRNASEEMAQSIASAMAIRDPLQLSPAQEALAGKKLSKLLRSRVAYHHSGLSYAVRAGLIEPLAKAGQLNVVVATMGLAAMGGKDRAKTTPLIPLALLAKVSFDAVQAVRLTIDQPVKQKAFCFWCLLAAAATFATVPLSVPEALAAWKRLRRVSRFSR